jgi:hypothetical protein
MPQAYSRRIVIGGVAYQVNVVERPDGSFTASVSSPPDSGGDDGHARSTEPSYWRAIKAAEDLLSARAGHRLWLANEDDIEWIRGYAGQDDAEFVDPNAAVEFSTIKPVGLTRSSSWARNISSRFRAKSAGSANCKRTVSSDASATTDVSSMPSRRADGIVARKVRTP